MPNSYSSQYREMVLVQVRADRSVYDLAEGLVVSAAGQELDKVCRHLEYPESTWHRWLAQYGGMTVNGAKRLKELEGENAGLKELLAHAELDKDMLREIASESSNPETGNEQPSAGSAHAAFALVMISSGPITITPRLNPH